MTALLDGRPAGLNAFLRPGQTFAHALTWPAGSLTGRTFAATLAGEPIDVDVTDDVMTLSGAISTAGKAEFVLSEISGGEQVALLVGQWATSSGGATRPTTAATVVLEEATVDVSVLAAPVAFPSREIDAADLTADSAALAVASILNIAAVPGLTVTVPDLSLPVYLDADANLVHDQTTAGMSLYIAPAGSTIITHGLGAGNGAPVGSGVTQTVRARARLAAHSPGEYGVFVGLGAAGNVTVKAGDYFPARVTALAV